MKTINEASRSPEIDEYEAGTPAQPADWEDSPAPPVPAIRLARSFARTSLPWIVGQMAVHIARRFQDDYEFWFLTTR